MGIGQTSRLNCMNFSGCNLWEHSLVTAGSVIVAHGLAWVGGKVIPCCIRWVAEAIRPAPQYIDPGHAGYHGHLPVQVNHHPDSSDDDQQPGAIMMPSSRPPRVRFVSEVDARSAPSIKSEPVSMSRTMSDTGFHSHSPSAASTPLSRLSGGSKKSGGSGVRPKTLIRAKGRGSRYMEASGGQDQSTGGHKKYPATPGPKVLAPLDPPPDYSSVYTTARDTVDTTRVVGNATNSDSQ